MVFPDPKTERKCVGCGCTDSNACPEGCGWARLDPNVCTTCVGAFNAGVMTASKVARDRGKLGLRVPMHRLAAKIARLRIEVKS